jgi:hypothetical protein
MRKRKKTLRIVISGADGLTDTPEDIAMLDSEFEQLDKLSYMKLDQFYLNRWWVRVLASSRKEAIRMSGRSIFN